MCIGVVIAVIVVFTIDVDAVLKTVFGQAWGPGAKRLAERGQDGGDVLNGSLGLWRTVGWF